jgi:chemotaxis protein CheD
MSLAVAVKSADSEPRRFLNPRDGQWHIQIMQGDAYVTDAKDELLTTVLGSCIAACIRDPILGLGGMNHFLLPEGSGADRHAQRFGVNAMEVLINGILVGGGRRERLEAKLFGGANVLSTLPFVGSRNAAFARQFLNAEGIVVVGGNVGGDAPRRIQYWPSTGRARQLAVRIDKAELVEREVRKSGQTADAGQDVELF